MKIVLLKDVPKVGRKYEVKTVADGFALNSLIPQKLAEMATPAVMKRVETLKSKMASEEKLHEELLEKDLEKLSKAEVLISGKTNEQGHLFASIHAKEIAEAIQKSTNVSVPEKCIILEKPLKEAGEQAVKIKVGKKEVTITVVVKGEEEKNS